MTDVIPVKRRDATSLGEFEEGDKINWGLISDVPHVINSATAISARRNSATRQIISAATFTSVIFNEVIFDRLSEYNAATGEATIQVSGRYLVTAVVHGGAGTDGTNFAVSIFVNGTEHTRIAEQLISDPSGIHPESACGGASTIQLSAGDVVTIRVYIGATAFPDTFGVTENFAAGTNLSITRIA